MAARRKAAGSNEAEAPAAAALDVSQNMAMVFGTPIVSYRWPDSEALNVALAELILAKEMEAEGISRSNVGGWHSKTDLFQWDTGGVRELQTRIQQMVIGLTGAVTVARRRGEQARSFNYRLDGWANVTRHQGYNTVHDHPNCIWSGVYYVASGEPEPDRPHNGQLELLDPRAGINQIYIEGTIFGGRCLVDPLPGLMVMFPSWLKHLVHPFFGRGERISIAFNVLTREVTPAEKMA
jgi:uncharacterized protein (TIGR02466 family)